MNLFLFSDDDCHFDPQKMRKLLNGFVFLKASIDNSFKFVIQDNVQIGKPKEQPSSPIDARFNSIKS